MMPSLAISVNREYAEVDRVLREAMRSRCCRGQRGSAKRRGWMSATD